MATAAPQMANAKILVSSKVVSYPRAAPAVAFASDGVVVPTTSSRSELKRNSNTHQHIFGAVRKMTVLQSSFVVATKIVRLVDKAIGAIRVNITHSEVNAGGNGDGTAGVGTDGTRFGNDGSHRGSSNGSHSGRGDADIRACIYYKKRSTFMHATNMICDTATDIDDTVSTGGGDDSGGSDETSGISDCAARHSLLFAPPSSRRIDDGCYDGAVFDADLGRANRIVRMSAGARTPHGECVADFESDEIRKSREDPRGAHVYHLSVMRPAIFVGTTVVIAMVAATLMLLMTTNSFAFSHLRQSIGEDERCAYDLDLSPEIIGTSTEGDWFDACRACMTLIPCSRVSTPHGMTTVQTRKMVTSVFAESLTARLDSLGHIIGGVVVTGTPTKGTLATSLSITDSNLTGSIPQEMSGMDALLILRVNSSKITGFIPAELSALTVLTEM